VPGSDWWSSREKGRKACLVWSLKKRVLYILLLPVKMPTGDWSALKSALASSWYNVLEEAHKVTQTCSIAVTWPPRICGSVIVQASQVSADMPPSPAGSSESSSKDASELSPPLSQLNTDQIII
jgi:hypothetical protein